jgi:hypothetical protein
MKINYRDLDEEKLSAVFRAVSAELAWIDEERRRHISMLRLLQRAREARRQKKHRAGPSGPA